MTADERRAYRRKRYQRMKSDILAYNAEYKKNNKDKEQIYNKKYYETHKDDICEYYQKNKDKINARAKECREKNKDKRREYIKEYYQKNKDKINAYKRKRNKSNPTLKLVNVCRVRINKYYKLKGMLKSKHTMEMIGCTPIELRDHIQSRFVDGMTFENHGAWHIDHIIPLASANTDEEIIKLCHYTNLQPLWAGDNWSKGVKIKKGIKIL
jgi:hypothetical protein